MKNAKKLICTALAALTIVSSSAGISNYATGNSFGNSISASAAKDPAADAQKLIDTLNNNINKAKKEIKFCDDMIADLKNQLNNATNPGVIADINNQIDYYKTRKKQLNEYIKDLNNIIKSLYFKKYTGTSSSIVDALKNVGAKSSYSYRAKIAAVNGIKNYSGSAAQNTKMLSLLKKGKLLKPDETAVLIPGYPQK